MAKDTEKLIRQLSLVSYLMAEQYIRCPTVKELVTLRIDQDVLEHFQESGPGWQDRINEALRRAAGK